MSRLRRTSPSSRMLVVLGILTVFGLTFGMGVYLGRIWQARSVVVAAKVQDEPVRRGFSRPGRPDQPSPQLSFYQELTAPLTAPPPPPKPAKPAKTAAPPLVALPPPAAPPALATPTQRPGEQADVLAAVARTGTPTPVANGSTRFTIQVASYRLRPQAEALRETLAAAGHEARVVEAESNGAVYRVQVGEYPTRDAARAAATRFGGSPYITTR